ncbi:hypothetical protein T459_22534 [Capsicum annuum]|uniref:Uncharacterized protein n=1 Tax=Capsicum annuum TaxID=4072 RepID=A0A2G2YPS8_CAPAN|nr:hypothetical protein T459_22534 [Capsicum annuum]
MNKLGIQANDKEAGRAESSADRACSVEVQHDYRPKANHHSGYQTIRVTGYHEKRPLQVLIDTGSTYNFIDQDVA